MKVAELQPEPIRHPQRETNALQGRDAKRIIKAKQALQKAHNSVDPSQSATTPYASNSRELDDIRSKRSPLALITQKLTDPNENSSTLKHSYPL